MTDPISSAINELTARLRADFDAAVDKYRELFEIQETLLRETLPIFFELAGNNPAKISIMESKWIDRDEWLVIEAIREELQLPPLLDFVEDEPPTAAPIPSQQSNKSVKPTTTAPSQTPVKIKRKRVPSTVAPNVSVDKQDGEVS